jgi:hypothetical protein
MSRGKAVYDQGFRNGVNIIRGENGSGKSTIADFIFYILGGEFEDWKEAASRCDEVQAELETAGGILTARRTVGGRLEPFTMFFGSMADAMESALEGWSRYPVRRTQGELSFSQVLFRSAGIPDAPSQGSANITAHQILRLVYADQRTPASRLFRFEPFDTRDIRTAVGELLAGVNSYDLYDAQLLLRGLNAKFGEKEQELSSLLAALPPSDRLIDMQNIPEQIRALQKEQASVSTQIERVDDEIAIDKTNAFLEARAKAVSSLAQARRVIKSLEARSEKLDLEAVDLERFISYLEDLAEKLKLTTKVSDLVGSIDFTHCPACLTALSAEVEAGSCIVCGSPVDAERQRSNFLQIKVDTDIQLRESQQLLAANRLEHGKLRIEFRSAKNAYQAELSDFAVKYDLANSPRESFLAERNSRLGQIQREIAYLQDMQALANRIAGLGQEKANLAAEIESLKTRLRTMELKSKRRLSEAMTLVGEIAKSLLANDLPRQDEFLSATSVSIDFGDDAIHVDGKMNFAESSNVVLKNSVIFALFLAATRDTQFWHPRFVLLDNVEDKGMEVARSHNFQNLIVAASDAATTRHQIIFTTSMIDPSLERPEYVVGPRYTRGSRSLNLQG